MMIRHSFIVFLAIFPKILMAHPFKHEGLVMSVFDSQFSNGSAIIFSTPHNGDNQNFIYSNGSIKVATQTNYCLSINRDNNDSKAILLECNGEDNQKFTISQNTIRPYDKPDECLTVAQDKTVTSEVCESSSNQTFYIPKVCLYKDVNYRNISECSDNDIPNVKENDTLSSISVVNSTGTLFEHFNFEGDKISFHGNIGSLSNLNDKVSSLKISPLRSFLITSDPQLVCQGNCNNISAETSKGNIKKQYEIFNRHHSDVDAVLINGDLTEYGHESEWNDFENIIKTLEIPYYFGLGNHDMYNNYNDCHENNCFIRSITKLFHHINGKENIASFDAHYYYGYLFPDIVESIKGSLSYSIDFGDILVIQLNDFESRKNPLSLNQYSSGGWGNGAMRYIIERYQDPGYSWLESQLYSAYKKKQIVIFNQHRDDADAGNLQNLLDKYKVKLRFSGHYHNSVGETRNGFILSGSSALGTYLKAEIDTVKQTAKIYKGVDNTNEPELISTVNLEDSQSITPPQAPAPSPIYVRVKTSGGYEAFVSLIYNTQDGKQETINSDKLLAGNSWEYFVPAGSTIESLEVKNNTGLVWEPQRRIFKVNNIRKDTCFATWGTTLNAAWQQVSCR
ncbi:metallophosphoesterase [Escherichia coli]|uniref:metallophosphoesterase n=1 Tax=Escherichia coli TaxID=562 RepID=UPI003CED18F5